MVVTLALQGSVSGTLYWGGMSGQLLLVNNGDAALNDWSYSFLTVKKIFRFGHLTMTLLIWEMAPMRSPFASELGGVHSFRGLSEFELQRRQCRSSQQRNIDGRDVL